MPEEERAEDPVKQASSVLVRLMDNELGFAVMSERLIDRGNPAQIIGTEEGLFLVSCRKVSGAAIPRPS